MVHAGPAGGGRFSVFARRPPPPGEMTYAQTIKFIDDGMKYIDPLSGFFVSPAGEMCFRTLPKTVPTLYAWYYKSWCVYPQAIGQVAAQTDNVTNIHGVRLWCAHAAPQCVHRAGPIGVMDDSAWIGNSVSVESVAHQDERRAVQNLVYLMGGNAGPSRAAGAGRATLSASATLPGGTFGLWVRRIAAALQNRPRRDSMPAVIIIARPAKWWWPV